MKFRGKAWMAGLALAAATTGAIGAAPAQARTEVIIGGGYGGPAYYNAGWRGYDRGWHEGWHGGYREWRGEGPRWRGYGPGYYGYGGGFRPHCWTEWRGGRWGGPVRICR